MNKSQVIEDPLSITGTDVEFSAFRANGNFSYPLTDWSSFKGVLLAVGFGCGSEGTFQGSAVMIAPGLAVGAWHVLAPHLGMQEKWTVLCTRLSNDVLQLWSVIDHTHIGGTDLVLFNLRLQSLADPAIPFHHAVISTRVPPRGELVTNYGLVPDALHYPRMFSADVDKTEVVTFKPLWSQGPVTETYVWGRDRGMLPWPCLEVGCPSIGAMSGGPVFDTEGALIGVLCSSLDTADKRGPSYVSLIFPALLQEFRTGWPTRNPELQILLNNDQCVIEGKERLTPVTTQGPDGPQASFHYRPE